jgi:hypothetical protein
MVAERAITLWPNVVNTIFYWESLCKSKRPKCKSYEVLASHYKDKLVIAKLQFFRDVALRLKNYLVPFQTDSPMLPFLNDTLEGMLRKLLSVFIRKEVLDSASTSYKLIKLDVEKKENHLPADTIKLGTAVKSLLRSNNISEGSKHQFKKDCVQLLVQLTKKLQERSPLKYMVVRNSTCLSPINMVQNKDVALSRFGALVEKLHRCEWISATIADSAKDQFEAFIKSATTINKDSFLQFDYLKDRVDEFLNPFLNSNKEFTSFWQICKIIFTLSHSQCAVERGFSVNKELLVENLQEMSLIAQRIVYDQLTATKQNVHTFKISNDLIKSCKAARSKYMLQLDEKREQAVGNKKAEKRKLLNEEITDIKKRKTSVESCVESLNEDIEKLSYKAEESNEIEFLVKANAFRRKVTEKKALIEQLDSAVSKLQQDLHKNN